MGCEALIRLRPIWFRLTLRCHLSMFRQGRGMTRMRFYCTGSMVVDAGQFRFPHPDRSCNRPEDS
ncbi:MAG: hypothetical protein D8M59_00345 [Planctomycetes bacterium]|nr:hypothetical protein [Planctomycetota bacterium]